MYTRKYRKLLLTGGNYEVHRAANGKSRLNNDHRKMHTDGTHLLVTKNDLISGHRVSTGGYSLRRAYRAARTVSYLHAKYGIHTDGSTHIHDATTTAAMNGQW